MPSTAPCPNGCTADRCVCPDAGAGLPWRRCWLCAVAHPAVAPAVDGPLECPPCTRRRDLARGASFRRDADGSVAVVPLGESW